VVDIACGTGDFCEELQRQGLRPVGVDFAAGMLAHAHTPAPLIRADVLQLPLRDASVDGVVCGFALRNVASIERCFAEAARVLRTGGKAAFLEVARPRNAMLRPLHRLYFTRVVPALGALVSDRGAYRYLPESVAYLPDSPTMLRMLADVGFGDTTCRELAGGAVQLLTATRLAA
jgi:demethylmenaquinone methyltransferase / 2-methoxy-6-polyprenyl-1,4-benzoquinol methylase